MNAAAAVARSATLAWRSGPWLVLLYAASSLLTSALPVAAAWQTKSVVDALTGPATVQTGALIRLTGALAVLGVAAGVLPNAANFVSGELSRRIGLAAHGRLFDAINAVPGLARFENPSHLDRLELARQAGETGPSQLFQVCLGMVQNLLTSIGFLIALAVLSPPLAGLALAAAVPSVLAHLAISRRRARLEERSATIGRRQGWLAGLLTEARAAKELRLYGLGGHIGGRVLTEQRKLNAAHRGVEAYEFRVDSMLLVLAAVVSGTGLIWAVVQAGQDRLTVGDIFVMLAALAGLQAGLGSMTALIGDGRHAVVLFGHYLAVLDAPPDLPIPAAPTPTPALRHGIVLRDVWFRYADDLPWTLRGVNLTIPAAGTCALVGVNGSGKSTIVKLLCRFYDPQRGSITWDGIDLRDMRPERLRARVAALGQDFMHYELSAHENIAFGDLAEGADRANVERAAELADAAGFLSRLPRGYETPLTRFFAAEDDAPQSGVQLSGGQWQRLALARTLLRGRADLLILDEPSSNLDAETEYEIHQRLRAFRGGKTSVLISHRLNCVRDADLIVVLNGGTVTERGSHDELMARDSEYSRLFRRQASGYTLGEVLS